MKLNVTIPYVTALKATDKALLVEIEGDEYWIPHTQVCDESEVWEEGDYGDLVITEWIAHEKGLA